MNYEDLIKTRLNSIYGIRSCCKTQQEIRLAKDGLIVIMLDKSAKEIIRNEIRTLKILKNSRSNLNF